FIDHGTGVVIGETAQPRQSQKLTRAWAFVARSLAAGQALRGKAPPDARRHVTVCAAWYRHHRRCRTHRHRARSTIGANVFILESVPPDMLYALGQQEHPVQTKKHPTHHAHSPTLFDFTASRSGPCCAPRVKTHPRPSHRTKPTTALIAMRLRGQRPWLVGKLEPQA
ncbi:MAG: hypothetical protein IPK32_26365, partial [Verrucomicrobiaceae bacterium]|nr:hypothetical protein [Verrucomicrobiaceae bacterium]